MKKEVHGYLILDKPYEVSSNAALQRAKKLFNAKKAGHAGTLDPLATGLLPICFGEATKFCHYLLESDKTYLVEVKLGVRTTTSDAEGEIVETRSTEQITDQLIEEALVHFRGPLKQMPSIYSALKHEGKPLYEYARRGIEVPRKTRNIEIYGLDCVKREGDLLTLQIHCSKGTYVRTLIDDLGERLGCGAYVYALRRLTSGPFKEDQMVSFEALEDAESLESFLLPIETALLSLPMLKLTEDEVKKLYFGQVVTTENESVSLIRLRDQNDVFIGLGYVDDHGILRSKRLLAIY